MFRYMMIIAVGICTVAAVGCGTHLKITDPPKDSDAEHWVGVWESDKIEWNRLEPPPKGGTATYKVRLNIAHASNNRMYGTLTVRCLTTSVAGDIVVGASEKVDFEIIFMMADVKADSKQLTAIGIRGSDKSPVGGRVVIEFVHERTGVATLNWKTLLKGQETVLTAELKRESSSPSSAFIMGVNQEWTKFDTR